ncbi:MAG: hypothetical protein ACREDP_24735, partial [Bradyrhizobium sp.]
NRGWEVDVVAGNEETQRPDLAFAIKPLLHADAEWVRRQAEEGVPVIVDLCDNIFMPGYGVRDQSIAARFRRTVAFAAAITVPTSALADVLQTQVTIDMPPVFIVPDIVETSSILRRERALVGVPNDGSVAILRRLKAALLRISWRRRSRAGARILLWFGNHGAPYANFGISDIGLFADALRALGSEFPIELWVVSNSREKFESLAVPIGIPCKYFEWDEDRVDALLPMVDICIVPNSLDEFSRVKSANRALKALTLGVPVVATPTSAYERLGEALWLGDPLEGMRRYLSEPGLVGAHMANARVAMESHFSIQSLGRTLSDIADRVVTRRSAR